MNLKRRVVAIEKVAGPVEELDGPINAPEWLSGEVDHVARRKLGRVGVRNAVLGFREAMARIDWDVPDIDDLGYPMPSHEVPAIANDNSDSWRTSS